MALSVENSPPLRKERARMGHPLPDVIRHTALRSSDFPLPASEDAKSDRPVRLPTESLYAIRDGVSSPVLGHWVIAPAHLARLDPVARSFGAYAPNQRFRKPSGMSAPNAPKCLS